MMGLQGNHSRTSPTKNRTLHTQLFVNAAAIPCFEHTFAQKKYISQQFSPQHFSHQLYKTITEAGILKQCIALYSALVPLIIVTRALFGR